MAKAQGGTVDYNLTTIEYKGKPYKITREKGEQGTIFLDKRNKSTLNKSVTLTSFGGADYKRVRAHVEKKTGKTDMTVGEFLEFLDELKRKLGNWEGEYGSVDQYFTDVVKGKLLKESKRKEFARLISAFNADQKLAPSKSKRGGLKAPTEVQSAYDKWAVKLRDEDGNLTGEIEYKDPDIKEWVDRMKAKRKDEDALDEERKAPPRLWKFLILSGMTENELVNMSADELIGKDEISGKLAPYPRMYRVNAIIKKLTNNKYSLFSKGVDDPKNEKWDLPNWETPSKSHSISFVDKNGEKIEWSASETKKQITHALTETDMGRTSWYGTAKSIRGYVKAGFRSLPKKSPLAQSVNEWVGQYADVSLSPKQVEFLKADLKVRNHDAYFFFILALDLGMRKTEAFTLNAMIPNSARKSGVEKSKDFPEYYDVQIMTWKTRWVGKFVNKELCAESEVNEEIDRRLKEISDGIGVSDYGNDNNVHALVGHDNDYFPIDQLQEKTPKQTKEQRLRMDKLYLDIKDGYKVIPQDANLDWKDDNIKKEVLINSKELPIGLTKDYFYDHPFHAFRHIMAQYQLELTNWDYGEVATMGHWTTLTVLKNSYGEKPDIRRYGEKIERAKKGLMNTMLESAIETEKTYLATEAQKKAVEEIAENNKLALFAKIEYCRSHPDEFMRLVEEGKITLARVKGVSESEHVKQKKLYEQLKEGGNFMRLGDDEKDSELKEDEETG
jgi:hypothetical protein